MGFVGRWSVRLTVTNAGSAVPVLRTNADKALRWQTQGRQGSDVVLPAKRWRLGSLSESDELSGWEGASLITSAPKLIMKWIATAYFSNFLLGIQRQQIGTGLHCNRDDDDDRQLSICRNNFRPPRQAINRGFSGPPLQAALSAWPATTADCLEKESVLSARSGLPWGSGRCYSHSVLTHERGNTTRSEPFSLLCLFTVYSETISRFVLIPYFLIILMRIMPLSAEKQCHSLGPCIFLRACKGKTLTRINLTRLLNSSLSLSRC